MKRALLVAFTLTALAFIGKHGIAGADEASPVAITHARVYLPGGRDPLDDATVVLASGKVRAVGVAVQVPPGSRIVDARGKVVTPGFIDAQTELGLVDVELEPSTNDARQPLALAPELRTLDGYNPRSILVAIALAGGVTSVVVAPRSGVLAGQSAFIDLGGETLADGLVRPTLAQYAHLDEAGAQSSAGTRSGMWAMLRGALDDARLFSTRRLPYDLNGVRPLSLHRAGLEAIQLVLRGEQPLVVEAHRASDIEAAMRLGEEYHLKVIVAGASEAWMVADELSRRKIAVIIDPLEDLPLRFDRLHARSDNAALLARAGVEVVFGTFSAHQVRLLWQKAGNAARLGMDHAAAIRAVTEAPAAVFGLAGYGRLEAGAVGNVVVWSGDPLQTSTRAEHVFVRGREQSLETRQSLLLDRYRTLTSP